MATPLTLALTCDDWRKRIWNSLTNPAERGKWWAKGIILEDHVGGKFEDRWTDDAGRLLTAAGTVRECEPNDRLSLTWRDAYWTPEQDSLLTLSLAGDEGRTRIELVHAPLQGFSDAAWDEERSQLIAAWTELLLSLRNLHHRADTHSGHDIFLEKHLAIPLDEAWALFTENDRLAEWLCERARLSCKSGGMFELCWDAKNPEKNSTRGCVFVSVETKREFIAQWRGPEQHSLMAAPGSTLLRVRFEIKGKKTRVRLIHTGFGVTPAWTAAREWQAMAWRAAFERLEEI